MGRELTQDQRRDPVALHAANTPHLVLRASSHSVDDNLPSMPRDVLQRLRKEHTLSISKSTVIYRDIQMCQNVRVDRR